MDLRNAVGLQWMQLEQLLWKKWQKSSENPFNQATLDYNTTAKEGCVVFFS
jgi:hypothetical protein